MPSIRRAKNVDCALGTALSVVSRGKSGGTVRSTVFIYFALVFCSRTQAASIVCFVCCSHMAVHHIELELKFKQNARLRDAKDRMRAHKPIPAPSWPMLIVVIECEPAVRTATLNIGPDLQTSWRLDILVAPRVAFVVSRTDDSLLQCGRKLSLRITVSAAPQQPGRGENYADSWIRRKNFLENSLILEQFVVGCLQPRTLACAIYALGMENPIEVQIKHEQHVFHPAKACKSLASWVTLRPRETR